MNDLIPKTERRSLRYDFSAKEIHDHALALANKTKELVSMVDEKKSVMSQFRAKVDEAKAVVNKLSGFVTDGFEMRDTECTIEWHKPQQGKKTIIRNDTNKIATIETMSEFEWNLFNQPDDDDTSDLLKAERDKLRGGKGKSNRKKKS